MVRPRGSVSHPRLGDLKWCFRCQQYKDINEFHRNKHRYDGKAQVCKVCRTSYERDYQRQYYLDHRDKLLPQHRISARESRRNDVSTKTLRC